MFNILYQESSVQEYLTRFGLFSGLIAAIGHDLNHKGIGSMYYIHAKSSWAVTYTTQPVLESMHAATLLRLLVSNNFFAGWQADVFYSSHIPLPTHKSL